MKFGVANYMSCNVLNLCGVVQDSQSALSAARGTSEEGNGGTAQASDPEAGKHGKHPNDPNTKMTHDDTRTIGEHVLVYVVYIYIYML